MGGNMRLKNKKTGEIIDCKEILILREDSDGIWQAGQGNSLAELNKEWEDYAPKEPLIKDEAIRKAIRAWAEVNGIDDVEYDAAWNAFRRFNFTICFDYFFDEHDSLEDGEKYTITELCGEEEE